MSERSEDRLSKREKEVLTLVSDGLTSQDIAEELGITVSTVAAYRARISDRLGIYGTAALTRFAICSQCTISSESATLKERIRQLESALASKVISALGKEIGKDGKV